jgi:SRSO17 transposase
MQRGLSEAVWDAAQMRRTSHRLGNEAMGGPEGVVSFDASGFPKQGQDSVGVARQDCGPLGQVDHGQVGVCAASASRPGYAFVDTRRFMPEPWLTDAYTRRRTQGQGPQARGFQPTPPFAVAMVRELRDEGRRPFKSVVADGLEGHSPDFLDAVEEEARPISCVSIPTDTRGWLHGPGMQTKQ